MDMQKFKAAYSESRNEGTADLTDKIDLPPNGICPCGCKDLMLAKDQTEYTPVSKTDKWEQGTAHTEDMDSGDPVGSVRLFCTACGQYFNVPEELT